MKHEWRKHEKKLYLPKQKPVIVDVPEMKFFAIKGEGNPNDDFFSKYIEALYALSYAVKMSIKKGIAPKDYFEYTVYPLEGVWDLTEEAKQQYNGVLDKNQLVFNLMIRQPEFVTEDFAAEIIDLTQKKKPNPLLSKVKLEVIKDGKCLQMMHLGSYDGELKSFAMMEEFCQKNGLTRISKQHREIYLSDARKVSAEKLKTVLRFNVKTK